MGRRGQRVPRLPDRHLRRRASATATRRVVAAIREQAARLLHVGNLFYTEPMARLADRLARELARRRRVLHELRRRGGRGGAEARAQGASRAATSSSLHGGFHGRTYGALSATPQETKQAPFAPLVPGLRRGRADGRGDRRARWTSGTAAVLLEPVQGESGVTRSPDDVLRAARDGVRRASARR